jgi:hypothetical protein
MLYPRGYFADVKPALEEAIRWDDWRGYGQSLKAEVARLMNRLPSHYDLLTAIRAGQARPKDAQLPQQRFGGRSAPPFSFAR